MENKPTSEWRNAWCACKDTVHDMKERGVFKTSVERLWEIGGGAIITTSVVLLGIAKDTWTPNEKLFFYGALFLGTTIVLWYLRCLHSLPAKKQADGQITIDNQRRLIAWLGGYLLTFDESQAWVNGSHLFDYVAWSETDQNLGKLQIENKIGDEAKSGRIRVRAMPLGRSDLIDLPPETFENHKFVLEPRTNRYVIRFGKNDENASMWGSIYTKTNPSVKVYDCPQFERAKIDEIWRQPGVEEYRKRKLLITADRDMSEEDARAHLTRFLGTSSSYSIDAAFSQAIEDEHITAWGRNGSTEVWRKIEKDQIAKAFPLYEYVPNPATVKPRLYSELIFCRKEFDLRWMIFD